MNRNRLPIGIVIFLWDAAWKGRAVQNRQYRWIAPLMVVNSLGILPMLYLSKWASREHVPLEEESSTRV